MTPKYIGFTALIIALMGGCADLKPLKDTETAVRIIFREEENVRAFLELRDIGKIERLMEQTVYDTAWNNGLMIKMTTPDYTLIREGDTTRNTVWLMMWRDNPHVKYMQQWYTLTEKQQRKLGRIMESYRPV